jgi:hypothetical protein
MTNAHRNRSGRRCGGYRPVGWTLPITRDEAELLAQEAEVRRRFGEDGVKLFWKKIREAAAARDSANSSEEKKTNG